MTTRESNRIPVAAVLAAAVGVAGLAHRRETDLGVDAATLVAEARDLRDREWGTK